MGLLLLRRGIPLDQVSSLLSSLVSLSLSCVFRALSRIFALSLI